MKELIKDLKKVITSNIDEKDKWCEMLIRDFIKKAQTKQLPMRGVVNLSKCEHDFESIGHQGNGHQECRKCHKQIAF